MSPEGVGRSPRGGGGKGRLIAGATTLGAGCHRSPHRVGFAITRHVGGSRAKKPEPYANRRSEVFCKLRGMLEKEELLLLHHDRLWTEPAALECGIDSTGKMVLERRDLTRQRLGASPDRADALSLSVANLTGGHVPVVPPTYRG